MQIFHFTVENAARTRGATFYILLETKDQPPGSGENKTNENRDEYLSTRGHYEELETRPSKRILLNVMKWNEFFVGLVGEEKKNGNGRQRDREQRGNDVTSLRSDAKKSLFSYKYAATCANLRNSIGI